MVLLSWPPRGREGRTRGSRDGQEDGEGRGGRVIWAACIRTMDRCLGYRVAMAMVCNNLNFTMFGCLLTYSTVHSNFFRLPFAITLPTS